MAASLDDTVRGIKIVPRTDPLQLQEGMYRPLQVHQGCTQVHCIMFMFGRLLGAISHLDICASIWIMRMYYMHRHVLYMCLRLLTSSYFKRIVFVQCTLNIKVQHIIIAYLMIPKTDKLPHNREHCN